MQFVASAAQSVQIHPSIAAPAGISTVVWTLERNGGLPASGGVAVSTSWFTFAGLAKSHLSLSTSRAVVQSGRAPQRVFHRALVFRAHAPAESLWLACAVSRFLSSSPAQSLVLKPTLVRLLLKSVKFAPTSLSSVSVDVQGLAFPLATAALFLSDQSWAHKAQQMLLSFSFTLNLALQAHQSLLHAFLLTTLQTWHLTSQLPLTTLSTMSLLSMLTPTSGVTLDFGSKITVFELEPPSQRLACLVWIKWPTLDISVGFGISTSTILLKTAARVYGSVLHNGVLSFTIGLRVLVLYLCSTFW